MDCEILYVGSLTESEIASSLRITSWKMYVLPNIQGAEFTSVSSAALFRWLDANWHKDDPRPKPSSRDHEQYFSGEKTISRLQQIRRTIAVPFRDSSEKPAFPRNCFFFFFALSCALSLCFSPSAGSPLSTYRGKNISIVAGAGAIARVLQYWAVTRPSFLRNATARARENLLRFSIFLRKCEKWNVSYEKEREWIISRKTKKKKKYLRTCKLYSVCLAKLRFCQNSDNNIRPNFAFFF